jgi:hypothetical protein
LAASLLVLLVPDNEPTPRLIPIARSGGSGTRIDRGLGEMITMDEGSKKLNASLLVAVAALFAAPLARTHINTTVNRRGSIFFNRV